MVLALCVLAACRGGGRELHSPAAVRAAYLDALAKDPRYVVQQAPGSSVVYVSFKLNDGPTQDSHVKCQRLASASSEPSAFPSMPSSYMRGSTS